MYVLERKDSCDTDWQVVGIFESLTVMQRAILLYDSQIHRVYCWKYKYIETLNVIQ